MLKSISIFMLAVTGIFSSSAQNSPAVKMVDYALSAVVTVAIYQTDIAMKPMGFRGNSNELAYSKALDLSGAKSSGSGFVIKKNNKLYVVTNAHVVQDAAETDGSIYIYSIAYKKYNMKLVGGDSFYDIAVLEFINEPGTEITSIKFRSAEINVGEQVFAIGNPLGDYPYSVTDGIISAKNRVRGGLTGKFGFLQSTATVIWGNSGGPLVDIAGDVVGINSQIAFADRGNTPLWQPQINFALEAGLSERLVNDIINNQGLVKRAYIGVEIAQLKIDSYYEKKYGSEKEEINPLPFLSAVLPGGPAAAALSTYIGYTITAINNETVRNVEEALGALEKARPNDEITFSLIKNGQSAVVKLKAQTSNVSTSTGIGKYAVSRWGGKSSSDNNMLSLNFTDKEAYANFRNRSTESISLLGNKNAVAPEVLFNNNWLVVAAGIVSANGSSLWKVTDDADLGSALRLTGLSGIIDLVLFAKGTDVNNQNNYIVKRFILSGKDNTFKQTLWY
ncbi:MAG: trypsin-like peptidase domain-containing protein [Ferruginibacter sp.]